jgi:hypothetical protein
MTNQNSKAGSPIDGSIVWPATSRVFHTEEQRAQRKLNQGRRTDGSWITRKRAKGNAHWNGYGYFASATIATKFLPYFLAHLGQEASSFPILSIQILIRCLVIRKFNIGAIPLKFLADAHGDVPQEGGLGQQAAVFDEVGAGRRTPSAGIDPLLVLAR